MKKPPKLSTVPRPPGTVEEMIPARTLPTSPERAPALDPALVEACRRGERRALEAVFRAEAPALERRIARMVGPRADVEDLLQATLIAAIGAFPRFRGEASVRTWLARIAVHVVRDHLRRPEQRRKVALELLPSGEHTIDRSPSPEGAVETRRRLARLYHHLDALDPKKRIAFVLHVLEGQSVEEVAALTDASVVATKSRIFWARRALHARLRKDPEFRELAAEAIAHEGGGT